MLKQALQLHQSGNLAEAERLYRQILAIDPRHADGLHLLGTIAHQVGRDDVAVELIAAAIAIDKRQAAYYCNLGTAQQALGKLDEAAGSYQRALAIKPDLAEAHLNLGTTLQAQGNLVEAAERFRRALALRPNLAEVHVNLGNILQAQGKLDEAAASQERALGLKPDLLEARYSLGSVRQAQGRLDEAVTIYERALALKPDVAKVYSELGNTLQAQKKLDSAVACYEQALTLNPAFAEACYNLGNARQAQNKLDEAIACYERALKLKPQLPEAHYNLGNTLHTLDRLEEAAVCFERALACRPTYAEAAYNLGCVFKDLGRVDEAISFMAKALEMKPDYAQARFGLALAQVLSGDLETGWRNYESRWKSEDHDTPRRDYLQPFWTGEKLESGCLLLWGEQGVGDEIMFAGMIPDALRTGNRIVLDCIPRLQPLFSRSFPEIEVICGHSPNHPRQQEFAAQMPTGSLPGLYRRSESAFAGAISPYLKADPKKREGFRSTYSDGRPLVGIAWRTSSTRSGHKRSMDLSLFAPLFAEPDLRWISLQYGDFDALEQQATAAQQAAEKLMHSRELPEQHTAGAEAHADSIAFVPGINPRPTALMIRSTNSDIDSHPFRIERGKDGAPKPQYSRAGSITSFSAVCQAPVHIDRSVDQMADIDLFAAQVAAMDLVITIDNSTAHLAGALGVPVWLLLPFAPDWRWFQNRSDSPWYPCLRIFRQQQRGDWKPVLEELQQALADGPVLRNRDHAATEASPMELPCAR
jgi:tetratricopeptide (TPR) repeat protein